MKQTILLLAVVFALTSAGNAQAAQAKKTDKDTPVASARNTAGDGTRPSVAPATTDPAYIIGPEDVIDINV